MANENDYDFTFSPEQEIYCAEDANTEGDHENTRTDCLLAIAKVLIDIRDELRRLNDGKS